MPLHRDSAIVIRSHLRFVGTDIDLRGLVIEVGDNLVLTPNASQVDRQHPNGDARMSWSNLLQLVCREMRNRCPLGDPLMTRCASSLERVVEECRDFVIPRTNPVDRVLKAVPGSIFLHS